MKKLILLLAIFLQLTTSAQQWDWAIKGTTKSEQYAKDICIDKQGNTFIIGHNSSSSYFGNISSDTISAGYFFAKFNTTGGFLWSRNLWGEPKDIKADALGIIYVVGTFTAPIITATGTLTTKGYNDFYISKFDIYGNVVWIKSYGADWDDGINGIAIDNDQNILVTGFFRDSVMFDNIKLKNDSTSWGDTYWTAKLNSAGNVQWANKASLTNDYFEGRGICTDKYNNVYVTARRGIPNCQMYCEEYCMIKYGSNGAIKVISYRWDIYEAPELVSVDDSCNVYTIYNGGSHYTWSPMLVKNDSSINKKWTTYLGYGYGGYIHYRGIAIDSLGYIYLAGAVGGIYSPGDSVQIGSNWVKIHGKTDILISKLDNGGNFVWSKSVEGSSMECNPNLYGAWPGDICVDRSGNCFLVADFNYQGSNGDTLSLNNDTIINDGNWEQLFVAKLRTTNPPIASIGIHENISENIFQIYPNPNSGTFTIMSNEKTDFKVCIYDLNGRCVLTKKIGEPLTSIDLSKQAKGLYFVEASTNDKVQRRKLLVE